MVYNCPFQVSTNLGPAQGILIAKTVPHTAHPSLSSLLSWGNCSGSSFQECYGKEEKKAFPDQFLLNLTSPAVQCLLMGDLY